MLAFSLAGKVAFALTGRCQGQHCTDLVLHRVAIGTGRWKTLRLPFSSAAPSPSMTASGMSLWIAEAPAASTSGIARLWASSDLGAHFVKKRAPCPAVTSIAAASADALWAVCGGTTPQLRRSSDSGIAWASVLVPGTLTSAASIAPASADVAVLATGTTDELLRTTDGGKTFRVVTPHGAHGKWAVLHFATSLAGGALLVATATGRTAPTATTTTATTTTPRGSMQLWRTADAGAKWVGPARFGS